MVARPTFEEACRCYVHRYTMEHVPSWAYTAIPGSGGKFYAPQYCSDLEWYENTIFPGEGHLHHNCKYCYSSNQSWPLGRSLSAPFSALAHRKEVARG